MTLALTFFLSTEMEELLTLRKKVESLKKDVEELEATILNNEDAKGKLELVERRVIALFYDADSNKPFVPPEPDEDELVSTCPFRIVVV